MRVNNKEELKELVKTIAEFIKKKRMEGYAAEFDPGEKEELVGNDWLDGFFGEIEGNKGPVRWN